MRLVLIAAGFILFTGGMLSLLSSEDIASESGWDVKEMSVWGILLFAVVPGIPLVFAGIMFEDPKERKMLDFVVLAVSVVMFFFLTTVVLYSRATETYAAAVAHPCQLRCHFILVDICSGKGYPFVKRLHTYPQIYILYAGFRPQAGRSLARPKGRAITIPPKSTEGLKTFALYTAQSKGSTLPALCFCMGHGVHDAKQSPR